MEKELKNKIHIMMCSGKPSPMPSHWDDSIFKKSTEEIINFLVDTFTSTLDEVEYYMTMPFLVGILNDDDLYVYFKDSPQYKRLVAEIEGKPAKACASITSVKPSVKVAKSSVKLPTFGKKFSQK